MEKLLSTDPPEMFVSKSHPGQVELDEEKELEDKFEKEKKEGVRRLIRMELWLCIAKAIRVIIFVSAILISLLSIVQK